MEPWLIAVIIQPIVLIVLSWLVLTPARKAVAKWPDSKLKRLLLRRIQ